VKEDKEARKERQASEEWTLLDVLRRSGNHVESEVPVTPERRWRVDHVLNNKIALEIEGYGRHQSWVGWHADLEKYNSVAARGWLLVRVTREMVGNGDALESLAGCGVRVTADRGGTFPAEGSGEMGEKETRF
jgi:hypothetical protein